jgi:putative toxin-antitoxin system antitoxin component (TIGR02293 family)
LNACPYFANSLSHHRPRFIDCIGATSILTRGDVPPSSVYRKMSLSTRLSAAESDVAARTLNIYANAKDVLEDGRLASKWLWSENALLQGDRPIETIDTQPGFDRVRDLLMRIEHGVAV